MGNKRIEGNIEVNGNILLNNVSLEPMISGETIKTINGQSILGAGDITIDLSGKADAEGKVIVSNSNGEATWADAVPMADNLTPVPETNNTMYSAGPTGGLADISTGEEAYLQEVKGYSIVWNQLIDADHSHTCDVNHIYTYYYGDGWQLYKNVTNTVSASATNKLFDLTLMFNGNDNIPFDVDTNTYDEYPANGSMPAQTVNLNDCCGFQRLFASVDLINVPYDAGTIKNVKATKLVETGQNLWDASTMEETGLKLLAGYRYEIYLDGNYKYIGFSKGEGYNFNSVALTRYQRGDGKYIWTYTPSTNVIIKSWVSSYPIVYAGLVHSGNYCLTAGTLNDSNNAKTNMSIPAYVKYEYPENGSLGINGLNGIPDSSKNHCSIYDTVDVTRVGSLNLSTLEWTDEGSGEWKTPRPQGIAHTVDGYFPYLSSKGYTMGCDDNYLVVYGSSSSPTGTIFYKLANPEKTGAEPFTPIPLKDSQGNWIVNDMGNEYFTGLDVCPVNQVSYYYENLKDKLVNLKVPNIASTSFVEASETLSGLKINDRYYKICPYNRTQYEWSSNSFYYNYGIGPVSVGTPSDINNSNYYIGWGGSSQNSTGCMLIGANNYVGQFADNCLIVGKNNSIGQASRDTIIGIRAESYRGSNVTIGYGAKSGNSDAYNSTTYSVVIGANSKNMINYCVSFDGTDFNRSLHMYSPENIFFRNDYVHITQSGWKNFSDYTQGHRLSEYIQNNELSVGTTGKYYLEYTDVDNYKTFTGNKASGTFTAIDRLINSVHITVVLTDNDTTPTWHSVVGMDLMLYDSINSLPYNSYARIDCGGTVEDIIAYIDAEGCVVITAPTGNVISSVKYNIK